MSLMVLGTVALDTVKTPCGLRKDMLGGSATHFAMSASLFTKVNLAAVIGEDFPAKHLTFLKNKGINLKSLSREKGSTFRWAGEYKQGDLNTACTLNTKLGVIVNCLPRLDKSQKNIKNVFLGNYDPDIQYCFLKELNHPDFVSLDTMNLWIHNKIKPLKRLLKKVHLIIINDAEAKDLSGEDNILKAAQRLYSYGPRMVIIKKGEHGCLFYSKHIFFVLPAYPVEKVIDPTGAGDTFAGGVLGYLVKSPRINEASLKMALSYATIISSFNVEGFGLTRTAILTKQDVGQRMRRFKQFLRF